jgi:hypothetical protein
MNPLFLRHGVTTVRDVGNNLEVLLVFRRRSQKPGAKRPRLFVCGPLIDGPNSSWGNPWIRRVVATADRGPRRGSGAAGPPGGLPEDS